MSEASERIVSVRNRVRTALPQGAKEPVLVAVTKGKRPEHILPYYEAGLRDFGENRVQEALSKIEALPKDIRWHFIGRLQGDKVRDAVGKFKLIHSIDSIRLLERVDRRAGNIGITQDVLLEVNVSKERTKAGFPVEELDRAVELAKTLPNVRVLGIMMVAPANASRDSLSLIFSTLRSFRNRLGLPELSMGMSDDFEIAVAEGATIIRIGRALFEKEQSL